MRTTPVWVWGVLLYLGVAAARDLRPVRMPAAVRAQVESIRVERDPRRMSARELRALPGLGRTLALGLAETRDRHRGPAALAWEDVPGIGEIRAARIRAWCRAHGIEPDPLLPEGADAAPGYSLAVDRWLPLLPWIAASLLGCGGATGTLSDATPEPPGSVEPCSERVRTRALLGGALHALECGPEEGTLVLLLHGARFSARTWEELGTLAHLARAGHHAIALDWPGYGATPRWDSGPVAATLLESVCDELGAEHLALVAPSMGGRFAFEFVAHSAARVSALVAVAPAGIEDLVSGAWKTPTLLVWGEQDEVVPLERGRALAERMPGARLEVLGEASHPCYLDQPARFHALLEEFLASKPVPPGKR